MHICRVTLGNFAGYLRDLPNLPLVLVLDRDAPSHIICVETTARARGYRLCQNTVILDLMYGVAGFDETRIIAKSYNKLIWIDSPRRLGSDRVLRFCAIHDLVMAKVAVGVS